MEVFMLKCIEEKYPDLKEMLKKAGLSVQGQDKYPLHIAIDERKTDHKP